MPPMSFLRTIVIVISLSFLVADARSELILDSGSFDTSTGSTGSTVSATSTFTLTADQIPFTEFLLDLFVIDDGTCVHINGMPLFEAFELSQFGPQDFAVTAVQPNDIMDPWSPNSNGLPRLTVASDASGTVFSGAIETGSTGTVDYAPLFSVADFQSLLVAGSNTIEFINHNGFQGGALEGSYQVSVAVPEPAAASLICLALVGGMLRRRR